MTLTYKYKREDDRDIWSVVGPDGGVHIWAQKTPPEFAELFGNEIYGGVEVHSRRPMFSRQEPSRDECWLIGGPCWHDGSTLYFDENIAPLLHEPYSHGLHAFLRAELLSWYQCHFLKSGVDK